MSNDIAVQPRTELENAAQKTLFETLGRYKKTIDALLPKMFDPKRFAYLAVTSIRQNPALAGVSPASFLNCVLLAGQMGLEIRRDSCYLIPFGKECQLLIDYKGKLDLARRSGKIGGIQAVTIRERDEYEYYYDERGFHLTHWPSGKGRVLSAAERGPIVGVYAFAQVVNDGMQWREPMSLQEIDRIRRRSRSGAKQMTLDDIFEAQKMTEDGAQQVWQTWEFKDKRRVPWVTDFEAMALKTALHSLCKGLPLSPEAQLSQEVDEGLDTGKQPNPLADAIDIDPVDNRPMVESATQEEIGRERARIVADAMEKNKKLPVWQKTILEYRHRINEEKWWSILGNAGYEEPSQIPEERGAAVIGQLAEAEKEEGR